MVDQVKITPDQSNPSMQEQEAAQAAASPAAEGKGKILGKFDSYEDLEKSYTELERKLSSGGSKKSKPNAAQEADADADDPSLPSEGNKEEKSQGEPSEDEVREAVEGAGVDFDALRNSYDTNGELSEEDYEALEKGGIPRFLVDEFIAGQEARSAIIQNQVFDSVGGEEAYTSMTSWAADNLTEKQIDIYNTEVNSGDPDRIKFAVDGLKAQWERSVGFEPSRQLDGRSSSSDSNTYQSWAQVQMDMADPRYKNDPAFRKKVESKMARSGSL